MMNKTILNRQEKIMLSDIFEIKKIAIRGVIS
jgi:hypothetical protein